MATLQKRKRPHSASFFANELLSLCSAPSTPPCQTSNGTDLGGGRCSYTAGAIHHQRLSYLHSVAAAPHVQQLHLSLLLGASSPLSSLLHRYLCNRKYAASAFHPPTPSHASSSAAAAQPPTAHHQIFPSLLPPPPRPPFPSTPKSDCKSATRCCPLAVALPSTSSPSPTPPTRRRPFKYSLHPEDS